MPELQLDLREAQSHCVDVCLRITPRQPLLSLALPRWTPGSYLLREYVGQLEGLVVQQRGVALASRRLSPHRWDLRLESLDPVEIRYRIQATELTVRTAHLTAEHGFLPLAAVVLGCSSERWSPHRLALLLPDGWQAFLPLPRQPDGSWLARDFDQLIDAPLEAGPHPCHSFTVAGVAHRWVSWGGDLPALDPQWLGDVERICLECCRLMGQPQPAADDYLFVLHLLEKGFGGLEHDAASVLQFGRRRLSSPDGRRALLQLVAHEYLHQWNVRRLRPAELVPIDYDDAMVVPTLWFAEGVTSYLDPLLPHAAGCCSAEAVLGDLAAEISRYRLARGRFVQSLQLSSEEAWVKLYRPHAHAANQQVSYYLKGAVLALVLDLHLRRHGSWLGSVLQALWNSHGHCARGYSQADLLVAFADQAPDLVTLLPQWLNGTDDPPLEELLADVGLILVGEAAPHPHLGWQLEHRPGGGVWVSRCDRHGPAQQAGVLVGDELIALDHERVRSVDDFNALLSAASKERSGRCLTLCREGLLRSLTLVPEPPAVQRWTLVDASTVTAEMQSRRRRWLALQP